MHLNFFPCISKYTEFFPCIVRFIICVFKNLCTIDFNTRNKQTRWPGPINVLSNDSSLLFGYLFPWHHTVWSEGFLYKVAPPELKISPIMYFVMYNSVVLSKILKIVVPFWLLFVYVDYYQNNQIHRAKNRILWLLWHNNFQYFG